MEILKITSVIKVGGSVAVIIPADIARQMEIQKGDQLICVVYVSGTIGLKKLSDAEKLQLKPPHIPYD